MAECKRRPKKLGNGNVLKLAWILGHEGIPRVGKGGIVPITRPRTGIRHPRNFGTQKLRNGKYMRLTEVGVSVELVPIYKICVQNQTMNYLGQINWCRTNLKNRVRLNLLVTKWLRQSVQYRTL